MNNDNISTIHDFDLELICEYFLSFDRQGPGSPGATLQALSFVDGLTANSQIADLGCGTGGQTITLASAVQGHVTAIDLFPKFIERLDERAWEHSVRHRVHGIVGSMDTLPFAPESLDLIWCEGAIYNIGFERGLRYWHQFLKPGGYVAVTENTYFTDQRPAEIETFWQAAYPEIDTVTNKIAMMQSAGYEFIAAFRLPEKCWTENYYDLQLPIQEAFLKTHINNPAAAAFIANQRAERALYDHAYWGYAFYIGRRLQM